MFDECKHLPMFELILPFGLWRSIQTQYEFKYDLKWLCYAGFYIKEDLKTYSTWRNSAIIHTFFKQDLFSINKKYKPARCVLFPRLPDELWSLIIQYSCQPKICTICGKNKSNLQYPVVCKKWYELVKKLPTISFEKTHPHVLCFYRGISMSEDSSPHSMRVTYTKMHIRMAIEEPDGSAIFKLGCLKT